MKKRIVSLLLSAIMLGNVWLPMVGEANETQNQRVTDVDVVDTQNQGATDNDVVDTRESDEQEMPVDADVSDLIDVPSQEVIGDAQGELEKPAEASRFAPRSIIAGSDERVRVTNTTQAPYAHIGLIVARFPNGVRVRGTGWLYGDGVVATAAHMLHSAQYGGRATEVLFYLGINGNENPFGTIKVKEQSWKVPQAWIDTEVPAKDYGYFVLDTLVGHQIGWLEIDVLSTIGGGSTVNVTGYPDEEDKKNQMWTGSGGVWGKSSDMLWHYVDTAAGQSGAPVYGDDGKVVAIHTYGDANGEMNSATLINNEVHAFLLDGMQDITLGWQENSIGKWFKYGAGEHDYYRGQSWHEVEGVLYFFDSDGYIAKDEWVRYKSSWYRVKADGARATSEWVSQWNTRYWLKADGRMAANEWVKQGNNWYWFKDNGDLATNEWVKQWNTWYFLKGDGAMAANEWVKQWNTWYFLKGNGDMATSEWVKQGNTWYWLKRNGDMAANEWLRYGNAWYWLKGNGAMAENEWLRRGNTWYWLKEGGAMAANERLRIHGSDYRFAAGGNLR